MNPFELLVSNLTSLGFFNFFLPYLFTFAVIYGLLVKTKVLGEDPKISGVVSLAIAFFTIGFGGPILGQFFINLAGIGALVLSGILIVILFVGLAGGDLGGVMKSTGVTAIIAGVGIIIVYSIFRSVTGSAIDDSIISTILIIIMLMGAVVFIAGGAKTAAGH